MLIDKIVNYKTDGHAVSNDDNHIVVKGRKKRCQITKGWYLCIKWCDGTTTWGQLANVKKSNLDEVTEYAFAQGIINRPAFAWWVPHTLRKRDRIIAAVNQQYLKTTHKFGIRVPQTVTEAIQINRENINTMWQDATKKETDAVWIAFRVLDKNEDIPLAY